MSKNQYLTGLYEQGQSIWYDNLSRDVLRSGELKKLIDGGVMGLTSNPTIFKQAIADTNNYDDDMRVLAGKGLGTEAIAEELMIADVAAAADLLLPIYQATGGTDGYASIEVSPFLARDTAGTLAAAERIWAKLKRPNIMIKIPATNEGIPAIRATLEKGINVNVTLIFSIAFHEKVIEAYLGALEARVARGEPVAKIASVASFFVSRVDAICEKKLDELVKAGTVPASVAEGYRGKIGIANSKLAYERYEQLFQSDRFEALHHHGAKVQRPLWASTGTKNPAFSPTLYVEALAGRDTVNTVPPATLAATMKGLSVGPKLHSGWSEARQLIRDVTGHGVPFAALLDQLQADGVKLFADAYQVLLDSIAQKIKQL